MTPKAATKGRATGTSFKGVFMYLQHDKRLEGQAVSDTADRVEWTEFRNLSTDNPALAYRIMRATANQQDALKCEAGQSAAGNKSDKVVFHYSLGWHPDEAEGLSKEEMLRAADESLAALGAEGHQAAIIAHNDTAHPHVHVVINRVSPENGKMLDLWNYQKRLSKWAMSYEQERGQIYCDKRVENWKRRDLGETFSAERDAPYHLKDQAQALGQSNDNDIQKMKAAQKGKDAELAAFGTLMHSRHSAEWKAYSRDYADGKKAIFNRGLSPTPFQQAAADVKADHKPLRSEIGKRQYREIKDFERNEKRLLGKLENAITAVSAAKSLGAEQGGRSSGLFNFLISSKARRAELDKVHRIEWRKANAAQKADIGAAINRLKADQQSALARHRQQFESRRQLLKDKQDAEKAELQRKWRNRKEERARAFKVAEATQSTRKEAKHAHEPPRGRFAGKFVRAANPQRKRKPRSRSRKPTVDE